MKKYNFYQGLTLSLWLSLLFTIVMAVITHASFISFIASIAGMLTVAISIWLIGELVFWIVYHD